MISYQHLSKLVRSTSQTKSETHLISGSRNPGKRPSTAQHSSSSSEPQPLQLPPPKRPLLLLPPSNPASPKMSFSRSIRPPSVTAFYKMSSESVDDFISKVHLSLSTLKMLTPKPKIKKLLTYILSSHTAQARQGNLFGRYLRIRKAPLQILQPL